MAISRIDFDNFLIFKSFFTVDFCDGINVFIGENGTGKTTLMKLLYGWTQKNNDYLDLETDGKYKNCLKEMNNIEYYFGASLEEMGYNKYWYPNVILAPLKKLQAVYIPTTEMLSHSRGFLALYRELRLPFDGTEVDILSKAERSETREITPNAVLVLDKIKKIIGGEVVYENDSFFVIKEGNKKTPFPLEASGFRKFGLLWKLLRNGLLEEGSILFWDEPENSLNPELVPVLVDILLELSKNGVQIFLATHDYNLARYFDVRKNKDIPVLFHNLSKTEAGQIACNSSPEYLKLPNNMLEKANEQLFEAVVTNAMGEDDDE
ncbi:MAG: AAA family ATPase [Spirochaetaceae bacterium]|jgi:AAA15 family ATPase/GTPase|nr:AAA family ATPase [Spirochaetaceae bacterium]